MFLNLKTSDTDEKIKNLTSETILDSWFNITESSELLLLIDGSEDFSYFKQFSAVFQCPLVLQKQQ